MVVVLIIGILLAIAIPTFLGARSRSQDAVAKSSISLATKSVLAQLYGGGLGDVGANGGDLSSYLKGIESSIDWTEKSSEGPKQISVMFGDGWGGFAALSESGVCVYALGIDNAHNGNGADNSSSDVTFTYGTSESKSCDGADAKGNADRKQF